MLNVIEKKNEFFIVNILYKSLIGKLHKHALMIETFLLLKSIKIFLYILFLL